MKAFLLCSFFILCTTIAYSQQSEKDSLKRQKKALKQAHKILKKLMKGGGFHQLAEKHSDDPGSAP